MVWNKSISAVSFKISQTPACFLVSLYSHYSCYHQVLKQCIRLTDVISCECITTANEDELLKFAPGERQKVRLLLLFPLQACISHVTGELKCRVVRCCRIPISQTAPGSPTPLPASAIILLNNAESSLLLLSCSVVVRVQQQQQHRAHCDAINMLIACR